MRGPDLDDDEDDAWARQTTTMMTRGRDLDDDEGRHVGQT